LANPFASSWPASFGGGRFLDGLPFLCGQGQGICIPSKLKQLMTLRSWVLGGIRKWPRLSWSAISLPDQIAKPTKTSEKDEGSSAFLINALCLTWLMLTP